MLGQRNKKKHAMKTVISFDAGDTLFYGTAFLSIAELTNSSNEKISKVFKKIKENRDKEWKGTDIFTTNSCISAYWSDIYRSIIKGLIKDTTQINKIYSNLMYKREHEKWYQVNEKIIPTLQHLRKNGFRLIVSSNWSTDLVRILSTLNIARFFSAIYTSAELRLSKPMQRFYQKISDNENSQIIHFGNDMINDVLAPKKAGWDGILIRKTDDFQRVVNNTIFTVKDKKAKHK